MFGRPQVIGREDVNSDGFITYSALAYARCRMVLVMIAGLCEKSMS